MVGGDDADSPHAVIDNVWMFKYLGSLFRADGCHLADIKARIAVAMKTAGQMRNIWASKTTPLNLKMRIYRTGVCSCLVYGSEAWSLDDKACAMLNGANSRMVARITGRTIKEEASKTTRTFDFVTWIRARRLQWVGHILRMDNNDTEPRLIYKAVSYIYEHRRPGDLLMDIPRHCDWQDLVKKPRTDKVGENLCTTCASAPRHQKSSSPSQTTSRAQKPRTTNQQLLQQPHALRLPHAPELRSYTETETPMSVSSEKRIQ